MELISDILLGAGAIGAAFYCLVLSRRLAAFTTLESGMGGAIAVLSAQVDDLTRTLEAARGAADGSTRELAERMARADDATRRLDLMIAALHDLPQAGPDQPRGLRVLRSRSHRLRSGPDVDPRREAAA